MVMVVSVDGAPALCHGISCELYSITKFSDQILRWDFSRFTDRKQRLYRFVSCHERKEIPVNLFDHLRSDLRWVGGFWEKNTTNSDTGPQS